MYPCNISKISFFLFLFLLQLQTVLNEIFLSEQPRQMWYGMFFIEFKSLLTKIGEQEPLPAQQQRLGDGIPQTIEKEIWNVVTSTIVKSTETDDVHTVHNKALSNNHQNFYDSLVDFVFCMCDVGSQTIGEESTPTTAATTATNSLPELFNGHLFLLLKDCLASYVVTLTASLIEVKQDFAKILTASLCKPLLVHAIKLQRNKDVEIGEESEDIIVAKAFVNTVIRPMCSVDVAENNAFLKAVVTVLKILDGVSKEIYLKFIIEVKYILVV